ncbi:heme exporter protein CcmA [Legionella quinlivanii]|uniref:Heme exporter protein CcmA n=1 Tax=Legionella quinlivanii TaxID=45073 RepID=A0A0W0Y459_9GAMM|nr:cytochrome c biogenesis heme-transporting ATPase CcmA [Legionella quinlivanii]KTD51773.1 heme exporter protein CcmA [Legionella quinlivanii]MCW8451110.1 cytochrome c biogenesis heme-transporting ATPase CcmA [Legionella quinlivanii]SEF65921.1 heme exporter protein A [Legionella quinlivanii DSM 21216]STY10699.1 heme exporter protein CcmA [Legionella quinlivanii]
MFSVSALSFEYEDQLLFRNVSFFLASGQLLHLKGVNGSGKTTLLRLIAGLQQPVSGDIFFNGKSIYEDLPSYYRQICYVGHKQGLSPLLTVRENCLFDLQQQSQQDLYEIFSRLRLTEVADKPVFQLSAGQRRRAGLLRILMTKANLWLLDEPLTALDEFSLSCLAGCLNEHLGRGGQVVMTSHQQLPSQLRPDLEYCL